jgi:hypothetical protein
MIAIIGQFGQVPKPPGYAIMCMKAVILQGDDP